MIDRSKTPLTTAEIPFAKFHGAGNDFVLLDGRPGAPAAGADWPALARAMCDRHFGIGADGILMAAMPTVEAQRAGVALRMRMFNPDGSESEMCGNGLRCFARWLADAGELPGGQRVQVETGAGVLAVEVRDEDVAAWMGAPALAPRAIPLAAEALGDLPPTGPVLDLPVPYDGTLLEATCVSMGNPHAVFFVPNVGAIPLERIGPALEHHPLFPARTNVEFVELVGTDRLRVRVWERGAGATLACGTGACASMVAARLHGLVGERVALDLPGGTLDVAWPGGDASVVLRGPAVRVFDGTWQPHQTHSMRAASTPRQPATAGR